MINSGRDALLPKQAAEERNLRGSAAPAAPLISLCILPFCILPFCILPFCILPGTHN
jgi:hypothetical protein